MKYIKVNSYYDIENELNKYSSSNVIMDIQKLKTKTKYFFKIKKEKICYWYEVITNTIKRGRPKGSKNKIKYTKAYYDEYLTGKYMVNQYKYNKEHNSQYINYF